MTRPKRNLVLVGFALIVVLAGFFKWRSCKPEPEPTYQGKTLTEWFEHSAGVSALQLGREESAETAAAVRAIGTNAIPFLVKWISYEQPLWQQKLLRFSAARRHFTRFIDEDLQAVQKAENAVLGFELLGPAAKSALPALQERMSQLREDSVRAKFRIFVAESRIRDNRNPVQPPRLESPVIPPRKV